MYLTLRHTQFWRDNHHMSLCSWRYPMLLQPFPNACDSTFISVWTWVRSVKNSNLTEKHHSHPAAFTLRDFHPKLDEQGLNVAPLDITAHWACKNGFQGFLVLAFDFKIVPLISTISRNAKLALN